MAAVSAAGQTGEVPSFVDRLGERFVVAQPSGALLEFLVFHPGLSSAPFFETEVKARLKRLSNFRHAAYARSTRLQRDPIRGNRLTLVGAYTAGRRLSDILVLARRGKLQPPIGAVLALAKQLMTGAALLHDYAPDVFHAAIGPERLVVAADGRLVITEYVLGTAVEQAVAEFGVTQLWRECRLATLADTKVSRYGRRLDLLQIGLVTLSLLLGRQLSDGDFPARLSELLDTARETTEEGEAVPLGGPLRDWLARLLHIDGTGSFKTLVEAQKAFGRVLEDEARYRATPEAVETFVARCEEVGTLTIAAPPDSGSIPAVRPTDADQRPAAEAPVPEPCASEATTAPTATEAQAAEPCQIEATAEASQRTSDAAPESEPAGVVAEVAPPAIAEAVLVPTALPPEDLVPAEPAVPAPVVVAPAPPEATAAEPAAAVPVPDSVSAVGTSDRSSTPAPRSVADQVIAEMLAALPKPLETGSAVDPFEPFPVAAPADQKPATPETPAPAFASWARPTGTQESAPHPRASMGTGTGVIDEPSPASVVALPVAPVSVEAPAAVADTRAWFAHPSTEAEPAKAETGAYEPGDLHLAATADAKGADQGPGAAGERRGAVLSYDEVHRAAKPRRSKAPFLWAAAVLVVLAGAGVVGGPKIRSLMEQPKKADTPRPPAGSMEPGGFKITTQPAGSRITIDGTDRGTSPLRVDDLAPGLHSIVVESEWGRVEEAVSVEAGKVVPLALATVGWIKIDAPVELEVSEDGRTFGRTGQPLMVPAGRHAFIFSNPSVAVRQRQFVQVPAGQTVKVSLDLPKGMLNLTSDQPAQVLLDGELIGDTPQVSVPAALGPHEVVFRSARFGDVSYSVNVTLAAPVSLTAAYGARR